MSVEREVDALVSAMNSSIEQASKFLNDLDAEAPTAGAEPLRWRL